MSSISEFQIEFKNEVFVTFFFWHDIQEEKRLRRHMIDIVSHYKKSEIVIDTLIISSISIKCTFRKSLIQIYKFRFTSSHS